MLYYPQLLTGSISQYPVSRTSTRRTITNTLPDGTNIRTSDDGAAEVGWDLTYSHLTDAEAGAIETLFESVCGTWQTFTFLDPTDNLLIWSEDLSQSAWEKDPLVSLVPGAQDPRGGTAGSVVTNTAQASQQVWQRLAVPGWYQYCLSAYVLAAQATPFELYATNGSDEFHTDYVASTSWTRVSFPVELNSHVDGLDAGIRLAAGQSVTLFGLQLEAQLGAGGYKKTRDRGGVYPQARFNQDVLQTASTYINQNSCSVKILSNTAG